MAMLCSILNLFILFCLCGIIMARPKSDLNYPRPEEFSFEDPRSLIEMEELYKEMQRYPENDPNDLTNWPWLRELINDNEKNIDYNNLYRDKYYDRLIQQPYHDIPEMMPTPLALNYKTEKPMTNNAVKDHTEKKNNYYMSLCHFKICNMGRKRNTRYLHLFDIMGNSRESENQGGM